MRFDGSQSYVQLTRNIRIVVTLQKQVHDLPLPRRKPNRVVFHRSIPFFFLAGGKFEREFLPRANFTSSET